LGILKLNFAGICYGLISVISLKVMVECNPTFQEKKCRVSLRER